jgi:lipopolysaccharide biosynthesis protein
MTSRRAHLSSSPSVDLAIVIEPGQLAGKRVCLFVSYAPDYSVKPHVLYHLKALRAAGLEIILILVIDGSVDQPIQVRKDLLRGFVVRKNAGFDFGAWADAFRAFPTLWFAEAVVLVNDSVFGPIGDFRSMIARTLGQPADFIGLTESTQLAQHYQSYFLVLKGRALTSPRSQELWLDVKNFSDKKQVILYYEIMLLRKYQEFGVNCAAMLSWRHLPNESRFNPTHRHWRDLLENGFPYIKVDLLRDWRDRPPLAGWREYVTDPVLLEAIDAHLSRAAAATEPPGNTSLP